MTAPVGTTDFRMGARTNRPGSLLFDLSRRDTGVPPVRGARECKTVKYPGLSPLRIARTGGTPVSR